MRLEKEYSNFHFHLALDRPDPKADEAGVPYTAGFVHQVMYNTYLKDHEALRISSIICADLVQ